MTPTERAKRSDALYYETVSVNRRVLCDMIANREADLEDALAENAKLRELISVMAYCNQFSRDCDGCSMNGASGIITERAGCDEMLARLRELGVEVSE